MFGKLAGRKTYIVAAVAAITAVAQYLTGDLSSADTTRQIFEAVLAATIRNGIGPRA